MTIKDEELAYAAGAGGTGGDTGDGTAGGSVTARIEYCVKLSVSLHKIDFT